MKQSQIRWIRRGSSKTSLIVCSPTSTARQPCPSSSNADLIGYRESSEVASTRAKAVTSSQHDLLFPSSGSEFINVFLIYSVRRSMRFPFDPDRKSVRDQ